MNQVLHQRNLETSIQHFNKSRKFTLSAATGSNKWWEERIMQEPVNKAIFNNMTNAKYLAVSKLINSATVKTNLPYLAILSVIDRYRLGQRAVRSQVAPVGRRALRGKQKGKQY